MRFVESQLRLDPVGSVTSSSSSTSTATSAIGTRAGFVDRHSTARDFLQVELTDCLTGFIPVGHLDEGEPARPTCLPIHNDVHRRHHSKLLESIAHIVLCSAVGEIANIDVGHDNESLSTEPNLIETCEQPETRSAGRKGAIPCRSARRIEQLTTELSAIVAGFEVQVKRAVPLTF